MIQLDCDFEGKTKDGLIRSFKHMVIDGHNVSYRDSSGAWINEFNIVQSSINLSAYIDSLHDHLNNLWL